MISLGNLFGSGARKRDRLKPNIVHLVCDGYVAVYPEQTLMEYAVEYTVHELTGFREWARHELCEPAIVTFFQRAIDLRCRLVGSEPSNDGQKRAGQSGEAAPGALGLSPFTISDK